MEVKQKRTEREKMIYTNVYSTSTFIN
jgi:hypothetical protein